MRRYGRESGFTIVELMIIVTIIGILIALVLPNMRTSAARARMTEAMLAFGPCRALVTNGSGHGAGRSAFSKADLVTSTTRNWRRASW